MGIPHVPDDDDGTTQDLGPIRAVIYSSINPICFEAKSAATGKEVIGMLILKRLAVWFMEMSSEALLLSVFMGIFSFFAYTPGDNKIYARDWLAFLAAIVVVFMAQFGYLVTTIIVRIFWTNRTSRLHPVISVVLFSIHLQIFFFVTGGLHMSERLAINTGGACIVFACTFAGGQALRKWELPGNEEAGALHSV